MNICVFIDTNIYLRFYDSKQSAFKKLLRTLAEVAPNVFCTNQIVDEINRNKEGLFIKSFDDYIRQTSIPNLTLPDHIVIEEDKLISEWNRRRQEVTTLVKKASDELKDIKGRILKEISEGSDEVFRTVKLMPIAELSKEIIENARFRKEKGNPPGKKEDPLGDQLNWESLLSYLKANKVDRLLIISNDNDFFIETGSKISLNTFLRQEIENTNSQKIEVSCFNSLVDALKEYNTLTKIKTLPSDKELIEIKQEEIENPVSEWKIPKTLHSIISSGDMRGVNYLNRCHYCSEIVKMIPGNVYSKGHKMYRELVCPVCGNTDSIDI